MERNPLYFNTDLGGLVPIANPDLIASNLIDWQTNNTTNLTIPLTNPALSSLDLTPEEIVFRAITYDTQAELFVYATEETALSAIGIVVGVTSVLIVQFCGVIRNTSFPDGNWYLSTADNGELTELQSRVLLVANNVIVKQVEEQMVNQAVITGGITVTSGLNVAATVGTKVNIGMGVNNKSHTFTTQTQLVAMPANSTTEKHIYIDDELQIELLDNHYLIVPSETNNDVTLHTGTINSTSAGTGFIYTAGSSPKLTMRATTTGTWASAHLANKSPIYVNYDYYEITFAGGTSNTQFGMIALDYTKALPSTNTALSTGTSNHRFSDCFYISMQTSASGFTNQAVGVSWSVHYTTAISHTVGVKVHGILVDRLKQKVYWSINGTWLNSGQAVASYTGNKPVVPAISLANNVTGWAYINTPTATADTFPTGVISSYLYYNKAVNQTYVLDYTVTPPTPVYSSKLYLGSLTSDSTTATITSIPPNNNTYTEETYLSELTTITHNIKAVQPIVTFNAESGIDYSISSLYPTINELVISASAAPVNNTIITVSC